MEIVRSELSRGHNAAALVVTKGKHADQRESLQQQHADLREDHHAQTVGHLPIGIVEAFAARSMAAPQTAINTNNYNILSIALGLLLTRVAVVTEGGSQK